MPRLALTQDTLFWGERSVPADRVLGFSERFGVWTGRAWLEVHGPGWKIPIDDQYGTQRSSLRGWFPDRPFASDWMDGRFPSAPALLPPAVGLVCVVALVVGMALVVASQVGWLAALIVVLMSVWPIGRLRDRVHIAKNGVCAGPPWATQMPWFDVQTVRVCRRGRRSWVHLMGPAGGSAAWVPTSLLPAVRARLKRLGGLEIVDEEPGLDDAYLRWRAPMLGVPWGVGAGTLLVAFFTPSPWAVLVVGALLMAGSAALALMISWRGRGWGFGGVLAGTLLYGVGLLAFGLIIGGWIAL
ncbi:MAG: hypothetical protein ACI9MC_001676 [Kiritimatiellia bacterium]|jgi:hypothetical protein